MKKPTSTVILNRQSRLVNNYLAKVFYIIENYSKQKSMIPNDMKLRINVIDKLDTYFVMAKNKAISSIANTINKLWMSCIHKETKFNCDIKLTISSGE